MEAIQVWCPQNWVAHTGKIPHALVIGYDQYNIRAAAFESICILAAG